MASVDLNLTALLITSIIVFILVFIFNLYLLIHFYLHKSFVKHKNDDLEWKRTQIYSNSLSDSIKLLLLRFIKRETLISIRNFIQSFQFTMDSEQEQQRLLIDQSIEPSPPPFDPLKPAIPISYPLKTLEELESRSYFKSFHYPFNIASTPLPTYSSLAPSRPRILVCHDMAGGYGDDKWVQGGTNEGAYAIWHWYLIDIFVYFSHSLVAIPPPCWINTAHKHGVKVLGTFITEWDEGRAICNTLLLTKESAEMYAERLTELAVALGFDGWLINMEVELDAGQIPNLKVFVNHLTQTMHSSMPGSLVIWYDSVTVDGNLDWQNQLNDKNKPFFDLSDGIFVNYTWQEDYPKLSAAVAGDRKFDVYMGIDVWGRNTYGGGQWTTNVALDVLKKDDVSAAIFAPAWVYESKQPPDFQTAQNRWWGLVEKSWRILNYYPKLLPFYSNFDQGHGYHISVDGQQISNDPWCNISCQSFQPVIDNSVGSSPDTIQVMVNFKDASFSGGGSLTFKGTLEDHAYYTTGIFRGELPLDDVPIHFTYSVKSDGSSLLGLSLEFLSDDNKKTSILLAYDCMNELASKFDKVAVTRQLNARDAQVGEGWILRESSISMKGYTLTQIHIVCYKSKLELNNLKLKQARKLGGTNLAQAGPSEFFASLGHITIKTPEQNSDFPPSTSWVVEGQNVSWTSGSSGTNALSIKIVWRLKEGDSSRFPTYNIYVVKQAHKVLEHQDDPISEVKEEYIAVAKVRTVYISDLVVPPGILDLKFIIQVCGPDGDCQKLDSCPALLVDVKGQ